MGQEVFITPEKFIEKVKRCFVWNQKEQRLFLDQVLLSNPAEFGKLRRGVFDGEEDDIHLGWMTPQESKNLKVSSTEISTEWVAFLEQNRTYPEIGWGAVGTKTVTSACGMTFLRTSGTSLVINPTENVSGEGKGTKTVSLKVF